MEINKIPQADLLDILFEGRNKAYGAYDLRKTYNRRLAKALAVTGSLCLLLIGGYTLAGKLGKSHTPPPVFVGDVSLIDVAKEKRVELPPPSKMPVQKIATVPFTPPRIVKEVLPDEAPPTQEILADTRIGNVIQKGIPDGEMVAPPTSDGKRGIIEAPQQRDNPDTIFTKVEIESGYGEGPEGWKRFLIKNFRIPEEAIAKEIQGTVVVEFIVDKKGNVSNVQAISGPAELNAEAVRVIKKSGKWTPAIQNGREVNSYKRQPITIQTQTE